jgi:hypothetical protein
MACKRPGVRVPLAPRFCSSKACCDLGNHFGALALQQAVEASVLSLRLNRRRSERCGTAETRLCRSRRSRTAKLTANGCAERMPPVEEASARRSSAFAALGNQPHPAQLGPVVAGE